MLPGLLAFEFFLPAGFIGSPVGNRNILVIFVWILWWFVLITIMVPFAGRFWCAVCPFPAIGQWIQRLSFLRVRRKDGVPRFFGLKIPWPKRLKNIWLQNALFLCLAIFSSYLVTRPLVSAGVLGGMMGGWGVMGNPEMMFGEIPYDSPERLLDLRYLHGDITRREYRRMLRHIE